VGEVDVGTIGTEDTIMAQPAEAGSIIQVTPRFLIEGQQTENVMYFRCHNASDDFNTDLLLVVAQCAIAHLLPGLAADTQLESVHGQIVGPAIGLEDDWTPATGDIVAGAASGDAEPSFVSAVVSLRTTQPGRSGRGRMFIGGIPEVGTSGSLLNIEGITYPAIVAFLACIVAAFPKAELGTGAHFEWGVYSRKLGGVTKPPFPDVGFHAVTSFIVRRELGTQRRRKIGRGR
jgi:hypothetical protein